MKPNNPTPKKLASDQKQIWMRLPDEVHAALMEMHQVTERPIVKIVGRALEIHLRDAGYLKSKEIER